MESKKLPRVPSDKIIIKKGKVQSIEQWTLWKLTPWRTMHIERRPKRRFFCSLGDPEHGGGSHEGTLLEALEGLHSNIQEPIMAAFDLKDATKESLKETGLRGYKLVFKN